MLKVSYPCKSMFAVILFIQFFRIYFPLVLLGRYYYKHTHKYWIKAPLRYRIGIVAATSGSFCFVGIAHFLFNSSMLQNNHDFKLYQDL